MDDPQSSFLLPPWPAPNNVHAVSTTRSGGASLGAYASFNLGEHVGDDVAAVQSNRAELREQLLLPNDPVWLRQVHGVEVVDAATVPAGTTADGAYTRKSGTVCAVLTADCLPIFLCDRRGTEVAMLHAGWRGLASGIVEAGVAMLASAPADLLACFGPAIGGAAYEVGAEVREAFLAHDPQAAAGFHAGRAGKWHLDLYALARQRLLACGVPSVYGGRYCTATQANLFYSYRRDGVTGRMASLIWLD